MSFHTLAQYLSDHTASIMVRWREMVRSDASQACNRLSLTNLALDDHLPSLVATFAETLDDAATPRVEEQGAIHGHDRRQHGYDVTEVLWELTLFRRLLLAVVEEYEEEIVVRVQDTGIGISTEMLPRVFDMFAQADTSLDRATGGLGVGLTVVKSLIEMHGGRIEAQSEGLGKGAEFVVHLPLVRSENAVREVTHLRPPKRVALVEDNPDARQALADVLETMGIIVLAVRDGEEAMRLAAEQKPDAYVVDIGLPGMDGYAVARSLRELHREPRPLLIALTGYGNPEDKQQAAAAGFDYHMTKPADIDELQRLLVR